jgi:hypothetical protein
MLQRACMKPQSILSWILKAKSLRHAETMSKNVSVMEALSGDKGSHRESTPWPQTLFSSRWSQSATSCDIQSSSVPHGATMVATADPKKMFVLAGGWSRAKNDADTSYDIVWNFFVLYTHDIVLFDGPKIPKWTKSPGNHERA